MALFPANRPKRLRRNLNVALARATAQMQAHPGAIRKVIAEIPLTRIPEARRDVPAIWASCAEVPLTADGGELCEREESIHINGWWTSMRSDFHQVFEGFVVLCVF
jgi:hypothetical protein